MMKIQESDFYEILPDTYRSTENRCISYALSRAVGRLCARARDVTVMAGIGGLSGNILDYLAAELRVPCYSQEMTREEKAGVIAAALPWHMTAGTRGGMEKLLRVVYGSGQVTEWFAYDVAGDPFHFTVSVDSSGDTSGSADLTAGVMGVISGAKNARSVLDGVRFENEMETSPENAPFIGCAVRQNILKSGAASTLTVIIGAETFDAETENAVDGGTFDAPAAELLDCGIF